MQMILNYRIHLPDCTVIEVDLHPSTVSLTLIWNDLCLGEQRIGTHTIYFFMLISPARGRKRTGPGRPAVLKDGKPGEGVGLFDDESL